MRQTVFLERCFCAAGRGRSFACSVLLLLLLIIPLFLLEMFARQSLFSFASYTNSEKLDKTIASLGNARNARIAAFGSSETLYGFDPHTFERGQEG